MNNVLCAVLLQRLQDEYDIELEDALAQVSGLTDEEIMTSLSALGVSNRIGLVKVNLGEDSTRRDRLMPIMVNDFGVERDVAKKASRGISQSQIDFGIAALETISKEKKTATRVELINQMIKENHLLREEAEEAWRAASEVVSALRPDFIT